MLAWSLGFADPMLDVPVRLRGLNIRNFIFALPRWLLWLLAIVCALHLAAGARLGLSVDEAHYALYALHPAWSYFDHPPLVGWMQWPIVRLMGLDGPVWMLRLLPGLIWLLSALMVFHITLALHEGDGDQSQQSAVWAVLAFTAAPLIHLLGLGLLPDTLLMLLTLAIMWQTLRMTQAGQIDKLHNWLLLGVLLGLAGLGKYTAIFTAFCVAWVFLKLDGFTLIQRKGPWLAKLLAVLMVIPVFYWNAKNQWVSFEYQIAHGKGSQWKLEPFLQYLIVQLLVFGPLLLWGWRGWIALKSKSESVLMVFHVLPLIVFLWMAGGDSSLPHWTTPAWVAIAPFAGIGLAHSKSRFATLTTRAVLALQALVCIALLSLMVSAGAPLKMGDRFDPFADLFGWDKAAEKAISILADQMQKGEALNGISVQNWTLASRIAWYARPQAVHVLDERMSQFRLWDGDLPQGASTLLVDWSQLPFTIPIGEHGFESCELLATLPIQRWGRALSEFRFQVCRGWSGKPDPKLVGEP